MPASTIARPLPSAAEVARRLSWPTSTATAKMNGSRPFTVSQWLRLCDAFSCHRDTMVSWAREIDARADARHEETPWTT